MAKFNLPRISSYGPYGSNYGMHCLQIDLGCVTIWYSYDTPIAFRVKGDMVVRENSWGTTTGKHLNAICPDKSRRISSDEFERQWAKQVVPLFNKAA